MNSLHSLRTEWRSEWQMPQNKISICTSRSVGSRRLILVEASPDVALAAEYAFALNVVGCIPTLVLFIKDRNRISRRALIAPPQPKTKPRMNGASGTSDIEGKAARVAA